MSELINIRDNRATIRWKLLTSASALALTAYVSSMTVASAEDTDRPTLWIEFGGQMENLSGQGEPFAPGFLSVYPTSSVLWKGVTPLQAQKPPTFSFGEEGSITFQPEDSDWVFSAGIQIGRSSNSRRVHHQTSRVFEHQYKYGTGLQVTTAAKFATTQARREERHTILDFSAGKDVGLGLFGMDGSSTLSLGVRFAQFESKSSVDIRARPDLRTHYKYYGTYKITSIPPFVYFHSYHAMEQAVRSFRGVGPSLSWSGSAPFVGNPRDGEITFDWGANVALLFGRQRAHVVHHESGYYKSSGAGNAPYKSLYHHPSRGHDTARSVTVPNVGGFAGFSWRVQDFKVSLGYRADFFFGAMDGGIDARKSETLGFKGPFASISIGLGD